MNMSPDQIQAILAAGEDDPQAQQLARRQTMIDGLRKQSMTPAPNQMAGNLILPNWAGAATNAMAGYRANQQQPEVDAGMKQVHQRSIGARQGFLDSMLMSMRKQYPTPAGPVLPPDGMEDR